MRPREALLTQTFVELADTLVDEFDVVEVFTLLADRCVEALDVAAAGLMLVAPEGDLRVMASSSEEIRLVELFELQAEEGPCLDAYRTGAPVVDRDLTADGGRWPVFSPVALAAGFRSVDAVPMRLRGSVIGALNLFRTQPGSMNDVDLAAARALADVATIAILQHRALRQAQAVNDELSYALNNRVIIEQAKGVLAERTGIEVDAAFARLRNHARNHNVRLVDVARSMVDGTLDATSLDPPRPAPR
jgi:GAF domain-containing protein